MTSGFFGFPKKILEKIEIKSGGFEFDSEIKSKIAREKLKIGEVPITLHPRNDGTEPKLHPFRDGWKYLRFMFLFAPNWLFSIPGGLFLALGLFLIIAILIGPLTIGSVRFDIHPMIFGAFLSILGLQIITFGLQSKIYAKSIGMEKNSRTVNFITKHFTLEKGLVIGIVISLIGTAILLYILNAWLTAEFVQQVKLMLVGMTLTVIGIQIIFSAWFLSMIEIEKK